MEDLAHDSGGSQNVDSVATQYENGSGEAVTYDSHFAGQIIDTHPYPVSGCTAAPTCLTDEQIQAEIKTWVNEHGLPHGPRPRVLPAHAPGRRIVLHGGRHRMLGGHPLRRLLRLPRRDHRRRGSDHLLQRPLRRRGLRLRLGRTPEQQPSDAALLGGLSHEHNESITDPELNAWYGPEGAENGDKCRTFEEVSEYGTPLGKAPDGSRYNQLINTREYWYQQEWSNRGSTCLQRMGITATAPTVTKLVPKTGPAAGGTSVTISGAALAGATAVHFGAASASFTVISAGMISATAPAGTSATVDVTVTTPAGTSAVTTADHYKYGAPTVTAVSPNEGPRAGGSTVSISGSGFAVGTSTKFIFGKAPRARSRAARAAPVRPPAPRRPKGARSTWSRRSAA